MTDFIACISVGKGTWIEVQNIINSKEFENIYLIVNSYVKENFHSNIPVNIITINSNKDISEIKQYIYDSLKGRIRDLEVALNLNSGIGKEHMAILQAVLELGLGIRQVIWKNNQIEIL